MTESNNEKLLLSLQKEVQALKNLLGGGVLSDLQSKVSNIEQGLKSIEFPITNWTTSYKILSFTNGTWDVKPAAKYEIENNGWEIPITENGIVLATLVRDENSVYMPYVYLNGRYFCHSKAKGDCSHNTVVVSKGDVLKCTRVEGLNEVEVRMVPFKTGSQLGF